jgi:ubiquinone biosynthesis protein Coq4
MNDLIIIEYKQDHSTREKLLLWLLGNVIPIHAKIYYKRPSWNLSANELKQYPENTLGNKLGNFLIQEKLEPVPKVERHDAYHILLDFDTTLKDEAAMQFFLIGNGKISPFTLGTAFFTSFFMPERLKFFYQEFKRGSKAKSIAKWNFKALLNENFEDLKAYINHQEFDNPALAQKLKQYES